MTTTIVCFGDSNTHGADPTTTGQRLPREVRWPRVMAAALGDGYEVIEEGLNGRCTIWDSPIEPGRNGLTYLEPCLLSHRPVDLVTIMLGTNDLKTAYDLRAADIAVGAGRLVDAARRTLSGPEGTPPKVLLVAPVPIGEITRKSEVWGFGESYEKSRQLAPLYEVMAETHGVGFFDAGSVAQTNPDDGIHLDAAACAALGAAMADAVRAELARA
jgi:lysophospholipase L1-like esterase